VMNPPPSTARRLLPSFVGARLARGNVWD